MNTEPDPFVGYTTPDPCVDYLAPFIRKSRLVRKDGVVTSLSYRPMRICFVVDDYGDEVLINWDSVMHRVRHVEV